MMRVLVLGWRLAYTVEHMLSANEKLRQRCVRPLIAQLFCFSMGFHPRQSRLHLAQLPSLTHFASHEALARCLACARLRTACRIDEPGCPPDLHRVMSLACYSAKNN
eukprot:1240416-Amphidinium_carterae.1